MAFTSSQSVLWLQFTDIVAGTLEGTAPLFRRKTTAGPRSGRGQPAMQEVSFLQHCRGGSLFEFRGNIGSNLPAVEPAILDENLIRSRAGDDYSSQVKSRDIAFQTLRIAFRAAV